MKINMFRGDLTDISTKKEALIGTSSNADQVRELLAAYWPLLLFSKLNEMFFGYFDIENYFLDNEN